VTHRQWSSTFHFHVILISLPQRVFCICNVLVSNFTLLNVKILILPLKILKNIFKNLYFFWIIFFEIDLNVVFLNLFFHSHFNISDSIFQKFKYFEKCFPKSSYLWSESQICWSNLIFYQSRSFFILFFTLIFGIQSIIVLIDVRSNMEYN
jgi:hypothetical protein